MPTGAILTFGFSSPGATPAFGVGVRSTNGTSEVYAPRIAGTYSSNATVVLLDSILTTEDAIESDAGDFNQLVDATSVDAYNARIQTKSYAMAEPELLKAYKSSLVTYTADNKFGVLQPDPVQFRYSESLEPVINWSLPAYRTLPQTSGSGTKTETQRVSFAPRVIDTGVSIGLTTNYNQNDAGAGQGQFKVYELGLNVAQLRRGRTVQ